MLRGVCRGASKGVPRRLPCVGGTRSLGTAAAAAAESSTSQSTSTSERVHHSTGKTKEVARGATDSVVLQKNIPPNYIREILTPHLEDQIVHQMAAMTSEQMTNLALAYSQLPKPNRRVAQELSRRIQWRMADFTAAELVAIVHPMYSLLGFDEPLYEDIALRLEKVFDDLTTLNLIGITRIYSRLPRLNAQQEKMMGDMIFPRLQKEVAALDTDELTGILTAIAKHAKHNNAAGDYALLAVLVPEVERKYDSTSLMNRIAVLEAFCKLRVYHEGLLARCIADLTHPLRVRNLPTNLVAKVVWAFARFGRLPEIMSTMGPLMEGNMDTFTAREFARLSQALPKSSSIVPRLCRQLLSQVPTFGRTDFFFFFLGCLHRRYFPTRDVQEEETVADESEIITKSAEVAVQKIEFLKCQGEGKGEGEKEVKSEDVRDLVFTVDRDGVWFTCLSYIERESGNFNYDEAIRIIKLLVSSPSCCHLVASLPDSWHPLVEDVRLDRVRGET